MVHISIFFFWKMATYEELTNEENELIKKYFLKGFDDYIRYPEKNVLMLRPYLSIAERIANFEVRKDDIWIVTYPKSGTTWTQEMVWQIVNDVDIEEGKVPLFGRTPFLEIGCILKDNPMPPPPKEADLPKHVMEIMEKFFADPITFTDKMTGRRVIKSHMPMEMLPQDLIEKCKVIYVARNIKDVAVSYFNHSVNLHKFQGNFDDFCQLFEKDLHMYGSYFHHIKSGWAYKDHPNFRFVWFEDMKKDIRKEVVATCDFINHPLPTDKLDILLEHISFKSMKKNMAINIQSEKGEFIRKGEVGDHKNHFDEERNQKWDQWIQREIINTGIVMLGI